MTTPNPEPGNPVVIALSEVHGELDALAPCKDCKSEPAMFLDHPPADPYDWMGVLLHEEHCEFMEGLRADRDEKGTHDLRTPASGRRLRLVGQPERGEPGG